MEQEARKLIGQKFLGFVLALAAAVLIEIFSKNGLTEWAAIAIMGIYAALCGSNAMISRGYARAQTLLAGAGKKPKE